MSRPPIDPQLLAIIRGEYESGNFSYGQLAQAHGIGARTIERYARRGGWANTKQRLRGEVATRLTEALDSRAVQRAVDDALDGLALHDQLLATLLPHLEAAKPKSLEGLTASILQVLGSREALLEGRKNTSQGEQPGLELVLITPPTRSENEDGATQNENDENDKDEAAA